MWFPITFSVTLLSLGLMGCGRSGTVENIPSIDSSLDTAKNEPQGLYFWVVNSPVKISRYFEYLDSVVKHFDSNLPYPLDEHLLIRANPWVIDTLAHSDYYWWMLRDSFVYDPNDLLVLRPGDTLWIPTENRAKMLKQTQSNTMIDLNIPEFTLRIIEKDIVLYTFQVRVGRNERKYLAMAGREVDLRTQAGEGTIVSINKNPTYINPSNNHPYTTTRRDDNRVTKLPRIPFLEPEINGIRNGQLIHPTTNPNTLGKAYSNGCIGMREQDAWRLYYYAPVGTKVRFRYDLEVINEAGDTIHLKDIYPGYKKSKKISPPVAARLYGQLQECGCLCVPD